METKQFEQYTVAALRKIVESSPEPGTWVPKWQLEDMRVAQEYQAGEARRLKSQLEDAQVALHQVQAECAAYRRDRDSVFAGFDSLKAKYLQLLKQQANSKLSVGQMVPYANLSGRSGVTDWAVGPDCIWVRFRGEKDYCYNVAEYGSHVIAFMCFFAMMGQGLNGYINVVKH